MEWIYDTKRRSIREYKDKSKEIDLTILESKFIEVLSNNETNTWREIFNYVYNYNHEHKNHKYNADDVKTIKCRLLKKAKLHIKCIKGYGLKLEDRIFIM